MIKEKLKITNLGALNFAAILIIITAMKFSSTLLVPILLSLFLAVILTKPVLWLRKKKVPELLAIFLVLILVGLIFYGLGAIIGTSLADLSNNIEQYEARFARILSSYSDFLSRYGFPVTQEEMIKKIDAGKVFKLLSSSLGELGNVMQDSLLIMFIVILMLLELDGIYYKSLYVKKKYGKKLLLSLDRIGASIRQYLWIKTLMSILTGALIALALWIIGVDYPLLWGLIAFLMNYIPNIGSIIAAIPTILFALIQVGVNGAIWTGIVYLIVNMVVGNFIEPKVTGQGMGLSTLVVFLSLLVWGFVFGTIGMFLSVPLTMVLKIILEQNEKTNWIAIMLSTGKEVKKELEEL